MQATNYISFFSNIKQKIREAQVKAALSANAQMIQMYWEIGKMISEKQKAEGWGANIISKFSLDLKSEMPELRGFSERNLKYMQFFANEYSIRQQPVAQLQESENQKVIIRQQPVAQLENNTFLIPKQVDSEFNNAQLLMSIPWGHHILLMQKIKDLENRFWYINQTVENGWSREVLASMIKSKLHERNRSLVNNFDAKLSNLQSELVKQTLKDPYILIF